MHQLTLKPNTVLSITDLENLYKNVYEMWVFGYGSILWKPGFTYTSRQTGKVRGFVRRFWQGNVTHRGTPELPGRVATLVDEEQGEVWGMAFKLRGRTMIKKALHHLGVRECALGGYLATMVPFEGRDEHGKPTNHTVLVFTAQPGNPYYMGPAPVEAMAQQILACMGRTGHNVEYVTRLADFIRIHIPEDKDDHLFDLDHHLRDTLRRNQAWLQTVLKGTKRRDSRQLRTIMDGHNVHNDRLKASPMESHSDQKASSMESHSDQKASSEISLTQATDVVSSEQLRHLPSLG